MTKEEAIVAMRNGSKVTHDSFTKDEWMREVGELYEFEDGCRCHPHEFWETRYESWWDNDWKLF